MAKAVKPTTLCFDEAVFNLIHEQATLSGQTVTDFMRTAVLEKLEDRLDYQDAIQNSRAPHIKTISRADVKKQVFTSENN